VRSARSSDVIVDMVIAPDPAVVDTTTTSARYGRHKCAKAGVESGRDHGQISPQQPARSSG
jgi:hypothetical protein